MEIVINGKARQVPDDISLEQAVSLIARSAAGLAAAVNDEVVRRASWPGTRLRPGDQVEVITAVQGG
jgi:sulfur carrier protein